MLREEAIAFIQQQLGHRSGLSSTIITNLQAAQTYLEASPYKESWFLLSGFTDLVTVADSRSVALPSDFNVEREEDALQYVPTDGTNEIELFKDDYDALQRYYTSTVSGPPEAYSLDGDSFSIWPKPDAVYTLRFRYFKKDQVLSLNIENGWLKHAPMVLIGQAGIFTAQGLRDKDALGIFNSMRMEAGATLATQNEDRLHKNRDYQMGGPEN